MAKRVLFLRILLGALALLCLVGVARFDNPWKVGLDKLTKPETGAKLADFVNAGEWTACLVNAVLLGALAATVPWWLGALTRENATRRPWWKSRLLWLTGIILFGAFVTPAALPVGENDFFNPFTDFSKAFGRPPASFNDWLVSFQNFVDGSYLVAFTALLILAAAVSWLVLPFGRLDSAEPQRTLAPPRAWIPIFYGLLLLIVGVAGWMRAPRLDHSLWNDEEYSLRRYVWGYQKVTKDDQLKPDRVKWDETFFFNRGANNHIPHSITARLSLETWSRAFKKKGDDRFFSEHAYRLPVFLAGLAGICVLALILAELGLAPVGITAAVLLTLHPWHLRYSVEARGYAWMLLFLLLAILFLNRALRRTPPMDGGRPGRRSGEDDAEIPRMAAGDVRPPSEAETAAGDVRPPSELGRWRDWLLYGLFQFLYIWSFPGAIYVAATMNALVLAWLGWENRASLLRRPLETPIPRLLIVNLLSGMLFLQAMAPSIPQIRLYLQRDISQGQMDAAWWQDIGAHLLGGVQWVQPYASGYDDRTVLGVQWPSITLELAVYILPAILLAGLAFLLWKREWRLLTLASPVAAAVLAYLHTSASGNFLFSWYILYAVPGLCALIALAPAWIGICRSDSTPRRALAAALTCTIIALFSWVNARNFDLVRFVPRQPLNEISAAKRIGWVGFGLTSEVISAANVAVFGVSAEQFRSYEPRVVVLENPDELREFICESEREKKPVLIYISGPRRASEEDRGLYKVATAFASSAGRAQGLEPMFDLELRYFSRRVQSSCEVVNRIIEDNFPKADEP